MKELWIGFAGSRFKYFHNVEKGIILVKKLVKEILLKEKNQNKDKELIIFHGGNFKSVDKIVDMVAKQLGLEVLIIEPSEWYRKDLAKRTTILASIVDKMYCIFVDTISRGTYLAFSIAVEKGKETYAYYVDTRKGIVREISREEVETMRKRNMKNV